MIAGLAALYGWTPDYILSRLTVEDALAFLRAGVRLTTGKELPVPKPQQRPVDPMAYQAPDRAGFARKMMDL